jgi:Holliday junction resolvase RusA-like endonuclease
VTARVSFDVIGVPSPQGSKKAFVIAGKARLVESAGAKNKAWRTAVSEMARMTMFALQYEPSPAHPVTGPVPAKEPLQQFVGPTHLEVRFRLPRPSSRPKKWHGWSITQPDLDKLLRSTLDGLKDGGLIRDDSIICSIGATKVEVSDWTGAMIYLTEIVMGTDAHDLVPLDQVPGF